MSDVRGYGRWLGPLGTTSDLLLGNVNVFPPDPTQQIIADWALPPGPPAPVQIPYTWLSPGLRGRPDKPLTTAVVAQDSGVTAERFNNNALTEYGDNPFELTMFTDGVDDPANLAEFVLKYYATQPGQVPRTRFPSLTVVLNGRTVAEQWRLLGLKQGDRITITDAPSTWPAGTTEQVVEGVRHILGSNARTVQLNTSPVIGATAGMAGPWFRLGKSRLGSGGTGSVDQLIP